MSAINHATINSLAKATKYAVRGPIVQRSAELAEQLKSGKSNLPFDKIIPCNIGNPHSLGQKPMSYARDVISLAINPSLKDRATFQPDVIARAEKYLTGIPGLGAYSESKGIISVREEVASFLEQRDGYAADPQNIFLTNGASEGVRLCMQTLLREQSSGFKDGFLAPIPQYPIYSALGTLLQSNLVPYYLDESSAWSCSAESLNKALKDAQEDGITIRSLVVINPGNPTGQVLDEANMREIVSLCKERGICLMADEVYQENIWKPGARFVSFRKIAMDMGLPAEASSDEGNNFQLISFHSISKGFYGECGLRGGYFELFGIPNPVKQEIYKIASLSLCSNTVGQIATGLMVRPPQKGEASYETYEAEKEAILGSLRRRAELLSNSLNAMEGVTCNAIDGALYAFPTIRLPEKAAQAAKDQGVPADAMYCSELLEQTGIVVVPGSGFGQEPGTLHFRITILPPENDFQDVMHKLADFHAKFLAKFK